MQLIIETLSQSPVTIEAEPSDSILNVKAKICKTLAATEDRRSQSQVAEIGMPVGCQRVIYAGRQLENTKTLFEYGITDGKTLKVLHSLRHGCDA